MKTKLKVKVGKNYSIDEEIACDRVVEKECGIEAVITMLNILIEDIKKKKYPNKEAELKSLQKRLDYFNKK